VDRSRPDAGRPRVEARLRARARIRPLAAIDDRQAAEPGGVERDPERERVEARLAPQPKPNPFSFFKRKRPSDRTPVAPELENME
jgi:hypothetical protein